MENIVSKKASSLSKMWIKILNLENCLFPEIKEYLGALSTKEEKLIKILDFAQIEKNVTVVTITNTPKDRVEIARAILTSSLFS
jgi:AAA+ ATPase superfamily predicted ATPase